MDPRDPRDHPRTVVPYDVIEAARALIGTPYRHQGRTVNGVDCVGLPILIMDRLGVVPKELTRANYGRLTHAELLSTTERYCIRLPQPELGCLLLIRWPREESPGHSAIYMDKGIIHAWQMLQRVVEHGYRGAWVRLTHSCWRLPGVRCG